ncbi:MAG: hypothetical protein AAF311_14315 [Pseudomonadota bacterium]
MAERSIFTDRFNIAAPTGAREAVRRLSDQYGITPSDYIRDALAEHFKADGVSIPKMEELRPNIAAMRDSSSDAKVAA